MRIRGSDALQDIAFETTYATPPATGFKRLPFVSSDLGSEWGYLEDDQLGTGREGLDPIDDVITNTGNHVVPVDVRAFGHWLKLFFGAPTTTDNTDGTYGHVFASGADTLPSMSLQFGHPKGPIYNLNYGIRGNTMQITAQRRGLLNATLGLIAKGESDHNASQSGTPTSVAVERFAQAAGEIKKDGAVLANVVSAQFSMSNGLEPVETIRADGEIEDVDPGKVMVSGSIVVRQTGLELLNIVEAKAPVEITLGWARGDHSLLFTLPRVFLPRPKRPIDGPNGIQATYNFQASGDSVTMLTATLVNDVVSYA